MGRRRGRKKRKGSEGGKNVPRYFLLVLITFVIAMTKILTKTKFWESVFFGL